MRVTLIAALILAGPAFAQDNVSPLVRDAVAVDGSARAAAAEAKQIADAAALAASQKCNPMAAVPPTEVPGGTTGSGTNCRLADAANNRISRSSIFSYASDGRVLCGGTTTCAWSTPLPSGATSYPVLYTPIGRAASCTVASSTNVGFTGMVCTQPVVGISLGGSSVISAGLTPGQVFVLSLPATQASQ